MASQPFPPRRSSEASQAGILTWGQILASLSDILLPIVVVRFVEIAEVGAIVALLLIYRTTAAILTAGFPRTVLYFLAEGSRGARKAVVRFLNLIMFCLAAAVAALLVLVRWIGPEVLQLVGAWAGTGGVGNGSELDEAFRFLPLLGIYAFTDLPVRLLRDILIAEGRAGTAALFAIAGSIGSTLVILVPVILGYGIPGVVVGHLVLGPLMLGWHVGLLRSLYGGAVRDRAPAFKTIVRYAVPLGFTEVVSTMLSSLDLWLVLLFLSVEQVALYKSGAWQLPVLGSLAYIVGSVYTPRFTRMFRAGEKREALAMWRSSATKLALIVVPVALAVFVAAEDILTVLFTDTYVGATPVLRCYCILSMIRVTAFGPLLIAAGKPEYVLRASLVTLSWNVGLSVPLLFFLGFIGPALGTALAIVPMFLIYCRLIARAWGVRLHETFPLWGYTRVLLTAAIPTLAGFWIRSAADLPPGLSILAVITTVLAGFATLGSLFGTIERDDWRFASSWLRHTVLRFSDSDPAGSDMR